MPRAGFEPATPASEQPPLNSATTGTGTHRISDMKMWIFELQNGYEIFTCRSALTVTERLASTCYEDQAGGRTPSVRQEPRVFKYSEPCRHYRKTPAARMLHSRYRAFVGPQCIFRVLRGLRNIHTQYRVCVQSSSEVATTFRPHSFYPRQFVQHRQFNDIRFLLLQSCGLFCAHEKGM